MVLCIAGVNFKIEQGYKHKAYIEHLLKVFYDWYETPSEYVKEGLPHSYYFYTFLSEREQSSPLNIRLGFLSNERIGDSFVASFDAY